MIHLLPEAIPEWIVDLADQVLEGSDLKEFVEQLCEEPPCKLEMMRDDRYFRQLLTNAATATGEAVPKNIELEDAKEEVIDALREHFRVEMAMYCWPHKAALFDADNPDCDGCGTITAHEDDCFRCLNCGNPTTFASVVVKQV